MRQRLKSLMILVKSRLTGFKVENTKSNRLQTHSAVNAYSAQAIKTHSDMALLLVNKKPDKER